MRELKKGENIFDDHFQYSLYKENIVEIVQMNNIPEALAALEAIKLIIKNTPILIPPNPTKQYIIYTDASEKTLGAVLCQIADDGRLRPIEYMSQNFSSDIADREDIPSKELRAINAALIKFKPYISKRQDTVVFCDNSANVLGLSASHETSATIEKMKFRITQHGIILKHIAGPSNPIADYLSRLMNPIKTSRSPQTAILPNGLSGLTDKYNKYIPINVELRDINPIVVNKALADTLKPDLNNYIFVDNHRIVSCNTPLKLPLNNKIRLKVKVNDYEKPFCPYCKLALIPTNIQNIMNVLMAIANHVEKN